MNDVFDWILLGAILFVIVGYFIVAFKRMWRGGRDLHAFFTGPPRSAGDDKQEGPMVESKLGQRACGLFLAGLGGYFVFQMWNDALQGEGFRLVAAVLFPVFGVLGLQLILFPIDVATQRWHYGTGQPRNWKELPPAMKVALILSLLAGFGNLIALRVTVQ